MPSSSSSTRKQTRLSFSPLPSSSPAASDLPEQIQNRAAAVRYDAFGSPTKKRRIVPPRSGQGKLDFESRMPIKKHYGGSDDASAPLPTPEPSSQVEVKQEEGALSLHNVPMNANQERIEVTLGQLLSSSSSSEAEDEIVTPQKSVRRRMKFDRARRNNASRMHDSSEEEEVGNNTASIMVQRAKASEHPIHATSSDESVVPSRPTRARRNHLNRPDSEHLSPATPVTVSGKEDSEPALLGSSRRGVRKRQDSPHTPQSSRRSPFTSSSRALRFISGGSSGAALIKRLPKTQTVTPTRSSKRSRDSSRRSRHQMDAESDDSVDSLMNEIKQSARKSISEPEQTLGQSEHSSDEVARTPRRTREVLRGGRGDHPSSSTKRGSDDPVVGKRRGKGRLQSKGRKSDRASIQGLTLIGSCSSDRPHQTKAS